MAFAEKFGRNDTKKQTVSSSLIAIVLLQHILLWSSIYIIASVVYLFALGKIDSEALPAEVSLLFCAVVSVVYICLHNVTSLLENRQDTILREKRRHSAEWLTKMVIRFVITIWMLGCAVAVIFTLAKHAFCDFTEQVEVAVPINFGSSCVIQRASIGASLLCLCVSMGLFVLLVRSSDPFSCHLFGTVREHEHLPLKMSFQNYKKAKHSEASFKCRTSASLESERSMPPPPLPTLQMRKLSTLHSVSQDSANIGLGIYSNHNSVQRPPSQPRFLTPRPSLHSIRSSVCISRPPSSSRLDPLPPLPSYLPQPYKRTPAAIMTAVHPPRRPYRPERSISDRSLRLIPSSPTPPQRPGKHTDSLQSLTSVYSQTSGGEVSVLDTKSISSESAATISRPAASDLRNAQSANGLRADEKKVDRKISASDGFEAVQLFGGSTSGHSAKSLRYFDRSKSETGEEMLHCPPLTIRKVSRD